MNNYFDFRNLIDRIYPEGDAARGILLSHSHSVADLACRINSAKALGLDPEVVETAAMVHDIGIIRVNASAIGCFGQLPYILHGVAGADILRNAAAPEIYARVAERHTGAGLSIDEAIAAGLPADRSYMPETDLEKLICYADCFFSKTNLGHQKSLDRVRASLSKFGPDVAARFEDLHNFFK